MAFSQGGLPPKEDVPPVVRQRVLLGRSRRRLSFERRLRYSLAVAALPFLATLLWACRLQGFSASATLLLMGGSAAAWWLAASYVFDGVVRPVQTLSNIVAALRDNDFSFRARGARRGDALGDLALEINALASTLQRQRSGALDALALADRVMSSMQSPVVAFDEGNRLRLVNAAAERAFGIERGQALRLPAEEIGLARLVQQGDESLYGHGKAIEANWSVRRAAFRLYGVPHTLFVLTDVSAALEEEERVAWQRLIRVLGHEINNSLTPIKSIASMLRSRPLTLDREHHTSQDLNDMRRGLLLIEDRADSLNRFLQAYQQMSRLPPPRMEPVSLRALVESTVPLEQRVRVGVEPSVEVKLLADRDQLQQLLINLIKNAAEAAMDAEANNAAAEVTLRWTVGEGQLLLQVEDNGPGLANPSNLFVPFYTTKPAGAGIGLTLSRQIAAGHRGSLQLRNRQGGAGCVAELLLPLAG